MSNRDNPRAGQLSPDAALFQVLYGYSRTQLIYVAAKLGIADVLHDGPRSSVELAQAVGAHEGALHRVMRGLTNIGVFVELPDGRFELTPLGACLRKEAPGSLYGWAIFTGEVLYQAWGGLLHTVQTGETAFDHIFGQGLYQYLAQQPEYAEHFNQSMTVSTTQAAAALLEVYDFSAVNLIVDVGGGQGALLAAILQAHPHMKGILLDAPAAAAGARRHLAAAGLADRCDVQEGDFFEAVPGGGDAYILSWVVLDWDDERSARILSNCRAAMPEHGKVLLLESVMPERVAQPERVVGRDLSMLVLTGGHERTTDDFRRLLAAAGFRLTRIIPTSFPRCVIEGVPVETAS